MMKKRLQGTSLHAGMTLVELIVVLAIVAIVSGVIIFNYSNFRSNVTLRNLSQEIALAIRKAQTYATSVRSLDGAALSTKTFPGYGISFSVTDNVSPNPQTPSRAQFILFADIPDSGGNTDGMYNQGSTCGFPDVNDECVESFTINSADRIVRLCTENNNCIDSGTVDVVFDRPAPDARMCAVTAGSCDSDRPSYLQVVVQASSGEERIITVWNTGQISVE